MRKYQALVEILKEKSLKLSTAESITGGKIISSIIAVPGASKVTEASFIVYSNKAKNDILGVPKSVIEEYGVVSEEVALSMAEKCQTLSKADIIISTTGEAGPNPNEFDVPVGTVCFGLIISEQKTSYKKFFKGNRERIIEQSIEFILNKLETEIKKI